MTPEYWSVWQTADVFVAHWCASAPSVWFHLLPCFVRIFLLHGWTLGMSYGGAQAFKSLTLTFINTRADLLQWLRGERAPNGSSHITKAAAAQRFNWIYANPEELEEKRKKKGGIRVN